MVSNPERCSATETNNHVLDGFISDLMVSRDIPTFNNIGEQLQVLDLDTADLLIAQDNQFRHGLPIPDVVTLTLAVTLSGKEVASIGFRFGSKEEIIQIRNSDDGNLLTIKEVHDSQYPDQDEFEAVNPIEIDAIKAMAFRLQRY